MSDHSNNSGQFNLQKLATGLGTVVIVVFTILAALFLATNDLNQNQEINTPSPTQENINTQNTPSPQVVTPTESIEPELTPTKSATSTPLQPTSTVTITIQPTDTQLPPTNNPVYIKSTCSVDNLYCST